MPEILFGRVGIEQVRALGLGPPSDVVRPFFGGRASTYDDPATSLRFLKTLIDGPA
ncbi:hypothetical protein [Micromonospora arborensis]|uniref:hypothetical protein n=1 Tax=Micromonospora arborensis TaxID=2116518 RepID=UPI0037112568